MTENVTDYKADKAVRAATRLQPPAAPSVRCVRRHFLAPVGHREPSDVPTDNARGTARQRSGRQTGQRGG